MRDRDVRSALYRQLLRDHASDLAGTRFVDELGVCGEVRVDVAVINGSLSGYELKSARDNLRRLDKQVEFYGRVLDYNNLVVAENHLAHAVSMLPRFWGVIVARQENENLDLEQIRDASENPSIDPPSLALLLWRQEALEELEARDLAKGLRSKSRRVLCEKLASELELRDLRDLVRERLKSRENWRVGQPQSQYGEELRTVAK